MNWIHRFFIMFLISPLAIEAQCKHHRVLVGPEVYYMTRSRDGGTEQTGTLYGFSFLYERVRHYGIYWGLEGRYAVGTLQGHDGNDKDIKSHKRDSDLEGSLGFTYQFSKAGKCLSLTPIVGGGYFWGKNDFVDPSPLTVNYRGQFSYYLLGILATLYWNDQISVGLRYKVKKMLEGECRVSDIPESDDLKQVMENENQYELELPIQISRVEGRFWQWLVTPFYRSRHYGKRENFPRDFLDTRFKMYGVKGSIEVNF